MMIAVYSKWEKLDLRPRVCQRDIKKRFQDSDWLVLSKLHGSKL